MEIWRLLDKNNASVGHNEHLKNAKLYFNNENDAR
nr:MAG TPA: hypothetical protein [Caudoviricetes sp.]